MQIHINASLRFGRPPDRAACLFQSVIEQRLVRIEPGEPAPHGMPIVRKAV
jgi:hypothetical protein